MRVYRFISFLAIFLVGNPYCWGQPRGVGPAVKKMLPSAGKVTGSLERTITASIIREHGSAGFHAPYRNFSPSSPIHAGDVIRVLGFEAPQAVPSSFSIWGDRIENFEGLRKQALEWGMPPDIRKGDIESLVWAFGAPARTADNASRYSLWLLLCLYARLDNPLLNKIVSQVDSATLTHASKTRNLFELYKGIAKPLGFVYLYESTTQSFYVVSFDKKGEKATVDGWPGEIVPEKWKYVEYVEDVLIGRVSVPIFKVKWDGDIRVLEHKARENSSEILNYAAKYDDGTITVENILADPVFNEYHAQDGTIYTREQIRQRMEKAAQGRISPTVHEFRAFGQFSTAIYRPTRQEIHDQILKKVFEGWENKVNKHPTCIVLGGRTASGKSKFNGVVYEEDTYLVLDPDRIKEMLPEYPGWNHDVHSEGTDIIEDIIQLAVERKVNVVLDGTMNGLYDLERRMQYFSAAGYRMEAHYMFVPRRGAAKRALMRFLDTPNGRYVPPEVVLSMKNGERNFDIIKDYVDAWSFSDNNVSPQLPPKLVARKGNFVYRPKNPTWLDGPAIFRP